MKSTAALVFFSTALFAASLPWTPASAGFFDVETKLTAADALAGGMFGEPPAGDVFGISVAISGNTVVVETRGDDDVGSNSGSAYLFDVATANELFKRTAADADEFDQFGQSVAISGNTALVGSDLDDDGGLDSGSAYLFDATTGNQLFKLTAADAAVSDRFGVSVAISGNTAIVRASQDDDGGSDSGSAYLFDVATGNQLFKLTADDAAASDQFGFSVAISGSTAIVGAYLDDDGGSDSGSAYLFDVATGNQLFKLTADDADEFDQFGVSVAISGNTAIVGSHLDDDGGSDSGSAYVFDIATGNQLFKLTADDADAFDQFGRKVAISGNTAIAGAFVDDDGGSASGSAYLFDVTTGNQRLKLTAADAAADDEFGASVGISGNAAVVGAFLDDMAYLDDDGFFRVSFNSGSAYVFTPEPSSLLLAALPGLFGLRTLRRRQALCLCNDTPQAILIELADDACC